MKRYLNRIVTAFLLFIFVTAALTACGRNGDNEEEPIPPEEAEEQAYTLPGDYQPAPEPAPELGTDAVVITVPIVANFEDIVSAHEHEGDSIYVGWDGIDTMFIRTVGQASAMHFSLYAQNGHRVVETWYDTDNNGTATELFITFNMEHLYYINQLENVYGRVYFDSAADGILLNFEPSNMSVLRFPMVGGFGAFEDVATHYFSHRHDGRPAGSRHSVQAAWNGIDTAFIRFTVFHEHGTIFSNQPQDTASWWDDDIVEIFMIPFLPGDESENRVEVRQWVSNSQHVFTMPRGYVASASHSGFEDNTWTVDLALQLGEEIVHAININGHVYGKLAVSLSSNSEWMLLGTTGGYWSADNYHKFVFDGIIGADILEILEIKRHVESKQKLYQP